MKKLITLFTHLMLCILSANAQFYLKTFTGYSWSMNTDRNISEEIVDGIQNDYVYTFKNGQGVNLGVAAGYQINHDLSVETNCNIQLFTTQKITIPSSIDNVANIQSFYISGFFGTLGYNHRIFQLSPQLMYRVNYRKINFYIKAGPNFLWAKNYISQYYKTSIDIHGSSGLSFQEAESYGYTVGKCNIGLQSSLGVEYPMSQKMALFGEILLVNSNYSFNKYVVKSYQINGKNQINGNTKTTYDLPHSNSNYSQIGLNLGVKYAF